MTDDVLTIILKDTFTLALLKHRLRILKSNLLRNFFEPGAYKKPNETISPQDLNWLNSLPPSLYQQFTKDNVYQIFEAIEAKVNSIPVLLIYLPFEADNQAIYQIGTFLQKNFDSLFLFDTKFNPALIAGCALSWKGVLRDYSLRARIEEKKAEIMTGFKKFLR